MHIAAPFRCHRWIGGFVVMLAFGAFSPINHSRAEIVTNVAQLSRLATQEPRASHSIRLEGTILWSDVKQGRFVLHDASGAEQIELDLAGHSLGQGDSARLDGAATIQKRGESFRIGIIGPVVNNDGTHSFTEKSGGIFLLPGSHPFQLDWFNGSGRSGLELAYEADDLPVQKIPDAVLRHANMETATGRSNLVSGIECKSYEGVWETLPDFERLTPVKTGTTANFNLSARTRDLNVGLQFTGFIEIPRAGFYTFHLKSDDGSRLFIRQPAVRITVTGHGTPPSPAPIAIGQSLPSGNSIWATVEGRVASVKKQGDGFELELKSGEARMRVTLVDFSDTSAAQLLNRRIRATGFCQPVFAADGIKVAGVLLVQSGNEIEIIEPADASSASSRIPAGEQKLPTLTTAEQVRGLNREDAKLGYPLRIRGVVTCVQADNQTFVIQDSTVGLSVIDAAPRHFDLPQVGEFVEIEGRTGDAGTARAGTIRRLGMGSLPEPLHPTWDQLLNGSLDSQWVEIAGLVESITQRPGWSRVMLRTRSGVLKVDLRRGGIQPAPIEQYENASVRLRGCMFADWLPDLRLKIGQIRMFDVNIFVDRSAPTDSFSLPVTTTASLMRFDPAFDTSRQVKVAGQIVYVRDGLDYFMMDGTNGLRFRAKQPLNLVAGDLVEAVGFPELSGAAPFLRAAEARKTGHAKLPEARMLASGDLSSLIHDSTLVRVEGVLSSSRLTPTNQVLEIQTGSWRFMARLQNENPQLKSLRIGSRLELTGVYCAQGGYQALGADIIPLDLLVNSSADIKVLAQPPWWTLRRLLVVVGLLAVALAITVLWITQLHRKVEQRTAELGTQIQARQQIENQRTMEQERTRIAQDLHDELGSGITEISMLAARAKNSTAPDENRSRHLEQVNQRAREMVTTLDEIVWAMNPRHDSLASLVSYFSLYADRFLKLAGINWQLENPTQNSDHEINSRLRHQLFLVFKEALTNVVRHSNATEVRLNILTAQNELRIAVADNGCGLPAGNRSEEMNGVANMRQRIERLRGQFEIKSEAGRGTVVRVSVPLN